MHRSPELQVSIASTGALESLVRWSGGEVSAFEPSTATTLPGASRAFMDDVTDRPLKLRELSPWLALLALLFYLADIVYRRWPRAIS